MITLLPNIYPTTVPDKTVVYTTSNDDVAGVDEDGVVMLKGAGEAVITLSSGGKTVEIPVVSKQLPMSVVTPKKLVEKPAVITPPKVQEEIQTDDDGFITGDAMQSLYDKALENGEHMTEEEHKQEMKELDYFMSGQDVRDRLSAMPANELRAFIRERVACGDWLVSSADDATETFGCGDWRQE